jgi:GNAT superfamily N-acetyltransferase
VTAPEPPPTADGARDGGRFTVTRATADDWSQVSEWAADEGWDPGQADRGPFFAQDPDGFYLGRFDGEPVSAVSVVHYGHDYAFLGFYLVRPDLRGRGFGLATWTAALAGAGTRTIGLDGVVAQQDNTAVPASSSPTATTASAVSSPVTSRGLRASCPPRASPPTPSRHTTAPAIPPTAPVSSPSGSPPPGTVPWPGSWARG